MSDIPVNQNTGMQYATFKSSAAVASLTLQLLYRKQHRLGSIVRQVC